MKLLDYLPYIFYGFVIGFVGGLGGILIAIGVCILLIGELDGS